MEYLKLFESHQGYEGYSESSDFITPNVSYCEQENEVHYNPYIRPNLCYRRVDPYYILCDNKGRIYRLTHHDTYYLGWNKSSTKLFHNMSPSGDYGVISDAISNYGAVNGEIQFSTTYSGGIEYLTNDTFRWEGTDYVFSNGTWTPSIPGGEYIDPDEIYTEK